MSSGRNHQAGTATKSTSSSTSQKHQLKPPPPSSMSSATMYGGCHYGSGGATSETRPLVGKKPNSVDGPSEFDIVCGRDKTSHGHAGNRLFRSTIQAYREAYQSCEMREDKTRITGKIIEQLKSTGARFLKREDEDTDNGDGDGDGDETTTTWVEVDSRTVHEKVSHALRSARDPRAAKKKNVRKKRNSVVLPPTPEEDEMFKRLYAAQQVRYAALLDRYAGGDGSEEGGDDSDDGGGIFSNDAFLFDARGPPK